MHGPKASGSCRSGEADAHGSRLSLTVLDALGKHAKGKDLGFGQGLSRSGAVRQDTRKLRNLGQPTAVRLALALKSQVHG